MAQPMKTYKRLGVNYNFSSAELSKGQENAIYIEKRESNDRFASVKNMSFSADEAKWLVEQLNTLIDELDKVLPEDFCYLHKYNKEKVIFRAKLEETGYRTYWDYDTKSSDYTTPPESVQQAVKDGTWVIIKENEKT